jgi:hypothetical protein
VFRAKLLDPDNFLGPHDNHWVKGELVTANDGGTYISPPGEWVFWRVDPETAGRGTEAMDKNGTEIFEGDVVKDSTGQNYDIVFRDGGFTKNWPMLFLSPRSDEVIGNIHDNPELIHH